MCTMEMRDFPGSRTDRHTRRADLLQQALRLLAEGVAQGSPIDPRRPGSGAQVIIEARPVRVEPFRSNVPLLHTPAGRATVTLQVSGSQNRPLAKRYMARIQPCTDTRIHTLTTNMMSTWALLQ